MNHRTCTQCGTDISDRHFNTTLCSRACHNAKRVGRVRNMAAAGIVQRWVCGLCGIDCERPVVRGALPKWCSQRCIDLSKKGKHGTCEECGVGFFGLGTRFCSQGCAIFNEKKSRRVMVYVGPPVPHVPVVMAAPVNEDFSPRWWSRFVSGPCLWCGENFTAPTTTEARACSLRCAKRYSKARHASARGGRFQPSPTLRRQVYERDNWICQLCMDPVDPAAHTHSDWYPSLDHIAPQSSTTVPDHSPENLRTAHRWCNAIRGDDRYFTAADFTPSRRSDHAYA